MIFATILYICVSLGINFTVKYIFERVILLMQSSNKLFPKTKFELEFNQGSAYSAEERDAILGVFAANAPSCGSEVLLFEKEFAEFNNTSYAIATGNASQGLEIACKAALLFSSKVNGEIIVPAISWIASASAAALAGGRVVFADVLSPTICVNPLAVKNLVSLQTSAVVIVHLYGRPVDGLEELTAWLHERGILVIEDCAHAVGAIDSLGKKCGQIGDIGVFSFHQQKNMVTLGEGGMCVTSNPTLRELMVGYRSMCAMSYDPKGKYLALDSTAHPMGIRYWLMDFADHGHNYRMTDMQASVGRTQLRKVLAWNSRRRDIANSLYHGLRDVHPGLIVADVHHASPHFVHSWHIYHVLVTDAFPVPKDQFMWTLWEEFGIKTWNHYSPMHLATSFRSRGQGKVGDCPVAESLFEQYVSLPIHPRLTDEAVAYMIDAIRQIASRPYVRRVESNPLLNALLALSDCKDQKRNTEVVADPIVVDQLNVFRPMIQQAIEDGLFSALIDIFISRAPGRLDLMGGNDDYTGGLVFECTIAESTLVSAQVIANSQSIVVRNRQMAGDDISVPVSLLQEEGMTPLALASFLQRTFPSCRWPLYVIGVLFWLQMRFPLNMFTEGRGLAILVWGSVPLNRGVSSSASVEVSVMKAAAHAFGIALSGEVLATACQWVENQVCSSACGLMDQMAVTLGSPLMAMRCQPSLIVPAPPLPSDLIVFALDSGVSHEISGIEYEAARAAAFMGYKIICQMEGLSVVEDTSGEITRFVDSKYNGYLARMSPSVFARQFEKHLPETIIGAAFIAQYGTHVDPATSILPEHIYHIRANTKYAVLENNRVETFVSLVEGCQSMDSERRRDVYVQLGELMYLSHDSYTECGLGSTATSCIVELVQALGPESGLFGAKITGGGAGGTVAVLGLRSAQEVFQTCVVEAYAARRGLDKLPYVFVGSSPGADEFGICTY